MPPKPQQQEQAKTGTDTDIAFKMRTTPAFSIAVRGAIREKEVSFRGGGPTTMWLV